MYHLNVGTNRRFFMFSNKFICATTEFNDINNYVSAPYFRKNFEVGNFKEAKLYVCGLGFYELSVNGKQITKGKLAPYISNPDQVLFYDEYDLTNILNKGKNVFGFLLGNGFLNNPGGSPWSFEKASFRSSPKLALSFEVDGKVVFEADQSFLTHPSPIIFDDYRLGEYYDGNLEIDGWDTVDFDDSSWKPALIAHSPKGIAKLSTCNPIRKIKEIKPVRFFRMDQGYIYDFGINCSGVCRLYLNKGYAKNAKVQMQYGEILLEDRFLFNRNICCNGISPDIMQKDIYIQRNDGKEEFYEPHFTYHGFRYVFIEGLDFPQATEDTLTMLVYNTDVQDFSSLSCDNYVVNRLQEMTVNSDLSNFHYFPTDCPHREKNGWTGDAGHSSEQFLYNFDCVKDFRQWLLTVRLAQNEKGAVPGIVPTADWGYAWGNGPAEDFVVTEMPYRLYQFTSDKEIIKENADCFVKYLNYTKTLKNADGLLEFGDIPDWTPTEGKGGEMINSVPIVFTDTPLVMDMLKKASFMLREIDREQDAKSCDEYYQQLRTAFRNKWVDKNMMVKIEHQSAQARAIHAGIFTAEELPQAFDCLIELIKREDDHMCVGVTGARVLFDVLTENGRADLAFKLMTQDDFPSYKKWVDLGLTTLAEKIVETYPNSFLALNGQRVLSQNHHFWGFISGWFYKTLAGLNVNPDMTDCKKIVLDPKFVEGVGTVNCTYNRFGKTLKIQTVHADGKATVKILENTGFDVEIK